MTQEPVELRLWKMRDLYSARNEHKKKEKERWEKRKARNQRPRIDLNSERIVQGTRDKKIEDRLINYYKKDENEESFNDLNQDFKRKGQPTQQTNHP